MADGPISVLGILDKQRQNVVCIVLHESIAVLRVALVLDQGPVAGASLSASAAAGRFVVTLFGRLHRECGIYQRELSFGRGGTVRCHYMRQHHIAISPRGSGGKGLAFSAADALLSKFQLDGRGRVGLCFQRSAGSAFAEPRLVARHAEVHAHGVQFLLLRVVTICHLVLVAGGEEECSAQRTEYSGTLCLNDRCYVFYFLVHSYCLLWVRLLEFWGTLPLW